MEQSLGIGFGTRNGEHLFRSTFVQTLFYGIFSAWVAHARTDGTQFDWRAAQWSMTVPVTRFLFQQAATPEALEPLELVPLLDAAAETLGRVDRAAFFTAFDDAQAVQYFYEPFLEYFDPELRRALGVWYTPRELVTYMVERIDRVLRTELGRDQGLADTNVWVLDPCCGTGSYVVEMLRCIRRTLEEQGLGDLVGERLKRAAMTRVAGFEIMTALHHCALAGRRGTAPGRRPIRPRRTRGSLSDQRLDGMEPRRGNGLIGSRVRGPRQRAHCGYRRQTEPADTRGPRQPALQRLCRHEPSVRGWVGRALQARSARPLGRAQVQSRQLCRLPLRAGLAIGG
jgi:hypothetical protein